MFGVYDPGMGVWRVKNYDLLEISFWQGETADMRHYPLYSLRVIEL